MSASRSPEQIKEAKELYSKHVAQAWADQQASSDAYDNNLLTYSSAALGISLAFVKDVVPVEYAAWLRTLYASWIAFAGCILVTITSFYCAMQAQRAATGRLKAYYLEGDDDAMDRTDKWARALPWCAVIGGLCFFVGIVCTIGFASKNMTHLKEIKRWQSPVTKQRG